MPQQLVKKGINGGYDNIMPNSWIEAIKDKDTGKALTEILQGFNMYFLSYVGDERNTRCSVPTLLRKKGLWITYIKYDNSVQTEWYDSNNLEDSAWGNSSNWREANNKLVGELAISSNGNWVINGEETSFTARGEKGITPLLRLGSNNKLQASYNIGSSWEDISDYIVPMFRYISTNSDSWKIQISMDSGRNWNDLSNNITNNLRISKYIGINDSLPLEGISEGTIYAKGPYYAEDDTFNNNPIYRIWVYSWKNDVLSWIDNGEFTSVSAGVVQEPGDSRTSVMSQAAITNNFIRSNKIREIDCYSLEEIEKIKEEGTYNMDTLYIAISDEDENI